MRLSDGPHPSSEDRTEQKLRLHLPANDRLRAIVGAFAAFLNPAGHGTSQKVTVWMRLV